MDRLIFAFMAEPGQLENQTLILVRSIRAFAGVLSNNPIWILVPETEEVLSETSHSEFVSLATHLIPYQIDEEARNFPLANKVYASATAESMAGRQTKFLAWMDSDSIVINEPNELFLKEGKNLGYRPVDHTLIGSPYEEPIDPFWEQIYTDFNVPGNKLFPMMTSVDQNVIRPYINAGMLVVRPETRLLQTWRENFQRLFCASRYEDFFRQNVLFKIFFHQAVLTGTVLSSMEEQELQELSHLINYPLHMHSHYPAGIKPEYLNEIITCRYDVFFNDQNWKENVLIKEPLKSWLDDQVELLDETND